MPLEMKDKGLSICLVSHFMDEVEMLCDQIGILRDGMFVFEGTVKEAVDSSPYSNLEDAYLWWDTGGRKQMKRFYTILKNRT